MGTSQQFSLRWNNYSQHLITAFNDLRTYDELTDVTLSCDGKHIRAHKVLLSACSLYFKETFQATPCKHPVVILNGVSFVDLHAIVAFMYNGHVNITQDRLTSFLQTAELLQIKGLTDINNAGNPITTTKKRPSGQSSSAELGLAVLNQQTNDVGSSLLRTPPAKRKRIGPSNCLQMQLSHVDSQILTSSHDGKADSTDGRDKHTSSPASRLHPDTVLLPSSTVVETVENSSSSDADTFGQRRYKYEGENEDEDYAKSHVSDSEDASMDMHPRDVREHAGLGHFLAGASSKDSKAGGSMDSSYENANPDKPWQRSEKFGQRRPTTESNNTSSSSPNINRGLHQEESRESNASNMCDNFSIGEDSVDDSYEVLDEDGDDGGEDRQVMRSDLPPLKPIKPSEDNDQFGQPSYSGSGSGVLDHPGLPMFSLTSDPMYVLKITNSDRQLGSASGGKLSLPGFRPRSASKAMSTGSQEPGPYTCDICGKSYAHHRSLNDHKKSHTGATLCHYCMRSFSKVANLRAHVLAQHKDKLPQAFSKLENLEQL